MMSKTMIKNSYKFAAGTAAALLLSGCMVGPKYHAPSPLPTATAPPVTYKESPTQFQETDGWKVAQPQDAMLHGKWWEIYNDPELNALEDKLNIDNQNIKQFFENFMTARTLIAEARSQLYPTATIGASYTRFAFVVESAESRVQRILDMSPRWDRCRPIFRGSLICGGRFAIRFMSSSTTRS